MSLSFVSLSRILRILNPLILTKKIFFIILIIWSYLLAWNYWESQVTMSIMKFMVWPFKTVANLILIECLLCWQWTNNRIPCFKEVNECCHLLFGFISHLVVTVFSYLLLVNVSLKLIHAVINTIQGKRWILLFITRVCSFCTHHPDG